MFVGTPETQETSVFSCVFLLSFSSDWQKDEKDGKEGPNSWKIAAKDWLRHVKKEYERIERL